MASAETEVTSAAPRLAHRPALDGLRGLAVLAVVLYHTGVLRGGWIGVDTFFVLSGYLTTSLLLTEWGRTGTLRFPAFWARRARRLLPALLLALAGVAVWAAVVAQTDQLDSIRADSLSTLFYGANWHFISSGESYFDLFREPKQHMAFAYGPHTCLGMHLARMETRVVVDAVLDRLPNLRLDPDAEDVHVTGLTFRAPSTLPVVFG